MDSAPRSLLCHASEHHPHFALPLLVMASLINALSTAVSPYVMPVVEKNLAPDFLVRFGELKLEISVKLPVSNMTPGRAQPLRVLREAPTHSKAP